MGLLSVIGNIAGSFFGGPTGGSIGGAIGGAIEGNKAEDKAYAATAQQNAENAEQARIKREWDEKMRGTAYQATVADLQAAGLNPMLAYSNGATSAGSGAVSAPMQNKALSAAQTTAAAAQSENLRADTALKANQAELASAQAVKTQAETGLTNATADNTRATLPNIQAELTRIVMNKDLMYQQGLTETARRALIEAQEKVAKIEQSLKIGQIDQTQADTALKQVQTTLSKLDIAGAQNVSDFESKVGDMTPGMRALKNLIQMFADVKRTGR